MKYLAAFLLLSATLFAQSPIQTEEEVSSELIAENASPVRFDPSLSLELKNPLVTNVYLYAAVDGGIFYGAAPNFGTSMRMQKGANGAELEFSVLPYHPLDLKAGLGYKASLSYLYHYGSKGSGAYLGIGPGFVANRHALRPLAVTWIGYQFLSQFPKEKRLSGFVDTGITSIFFKDGSNSLVVTSKPVLIFVPVLRGGVGFSF